MVRIRGFGFCLVLSLFATPAWADSTRRPRAHVDSVQTYGGPNANEGNSFVRQAVVQAGYEPVFSVEEQACGTNPKCHMERGRKTSATISLQATVVNVAGEVAVSFYVVDVKSGSVSQSKQDGVELTSPPPGLQAALPPPKSPTSSKGRKVAAWTLTGAGVALAVGGSLAWLHSRSLRSDFLDNHVDGKGNVFGISQAAARKKETSAKRWELAGLLLWTAAAGSGVAATVLFVSDREGQAPRPAGIAMAVEF